MQETYTRWSQLDDDERAAIRNPAAWMTTVASRVALSILDSARHRRERYVGEWLPEPLPGSPLTGSDPLDPLDRITLDESVSMALLVVLESLTPAERVAFVLHDVFGLPFAEIAGIVGRSPDAARQLASSARRHVRDRRQGAAAPAQHTEVVRAFREAARTGDLAGLTRLLDPDVTAISDGGGRIRAALRPVRGADRVGRFLVGALSKRPAMVVEERQVNGETGLVFRSEGEGVGVVTLAVLAGRIHDVWLMLNPEKLGAWSAAERGPSAASHSGSLCRRDE